MKKNSVIFVIFVFLAGIISGCAGKHGHHHGHGHGHDHGKHGAKIGAPSKGMSSEEYQSLVLLDPQNTTHAKFKGINGRDG